MEQALLPEIKSEAPVLFPRGEPFLVWVMGRAAEEERFAGGGRRRFLP